MEGFLYFLPEHPANICDFYIRIYCRPKQSGPNLAKMLFCLRHCANMAILLPRSRARISAVPCSITMTRERFLGPAVPSAQRLVLMPNLPASPLIGWLPDLRQVSQAFLKPFFRTLYILSGLDPLQIARSTKHYVAVGSQYLCFCKKNSGKGATLHHVFVRCLTPGSADLLQIINSHQIAYLSTNSGSEEDKFIHLQKPSLAGSLFVHIFYINIKQDLVC